ncbi:Ribokinase-like protein [Pluteus cervinus]|uniref:Ribokinase-like protein n=1 Tax=Pluteus cervinus TaxID=181527 RepID=A0ACD3A8U9_9AGAR|nr:Ribokinase-like protein [Pluteus cervinus]
MANPTECLCIVRGSINRDEYFHVKSIARPGETISSTKYESRIGGKGANQAVAIARAGGNVKFYGTIGKDGLWIKDEMNSYGVDASSILVSEEPTGRALIQVAEDGENSIVLFPGANHNQLHEQTPTSIFGSSFTNSNATTTTTQIQPTHLLLQNEIHFDSTIQAMKKFGKQACIIFNPSPLPSAEQIRREVPWENITWLIINRGEAEDLVSAFGNTGLTPDSPIDEVISGLESQPSLKDVNIVCTLGSNGVIGFLPSMHRTPDGPSILYVPASRVVGGVKDTTGAGDCFTGYFVAGLMELGPGKWVGDGISQEDVVGLLERCVQAAAMCVEKPGTIDSIPSRGEVDERMKDRPT